MDTQRQLAVEIERYTQRLQQLRDKVRHNQCIVALLRTSQVQRNRTNPALDYQHTAKRLSVSLVTFTQLIEGRSLHCRVVAHALQISSSSTSTTGTSMCGSMPRLPRRSGLSAARRSRPSPRLLRLVIMAVSPRTHARQIFDGLDGVRSGMQKLQASQQHAAYGSLLLCVC